MNIYKKPKRYTQKEALLKIRRYCAYQERCSFEVRNKLYEYGLNKDTVEQIIITLIADNFIDEERFARVYAGGKFRMKKWGRRKIEAALLQKEIPRQCIEMALKEIDEKEYIATLQSLANKKINSYRKGDATLTKKKVTSYLLNKGYEYEYVEQVLKGMEL
ncbi:MAG: RecX family transcriptional regulator [Cytophagaceae bacterium]|nr:RecX family transcriptional regulator [Cytophagaceae bacterium]MDW8456499.1 regulatory protein RecX [Cytophagaceae bacterium]